MSSKSSRISLYSNTCWRIFELSTHVTKSSIVRVIRKAGSFTTSEPTRTWPCSINFEAFLMFSDILLRTITTGSLRLQKVLAETLLAPSRSHLVGIIPITYNFSSNCPLVSVLKGWFLSTFAIFSAMFLICRDNALYLKSHQTLANNKEHDKSELTSYSLLVWKCCIFSSLLLRASCYRPSNSGSQPSSAAFVHEISACEPLWDVVDINLVFFNVQCVFVVCFGLHEFVQLEYKSPTPRS